MRVVVNVVVVVVADRVTVLWTGATVRSKATVESSRRNVEVLAELLVDTFGPSVNFSRGHEGPELGVQLHSAVFALAPVGPAIGSSHVRTIQHALPISTMPCRSDEISQSPSIGGLD